MTFLNAILALGSMAFAVPLVIHLLNRNRYLTIDWGAMQFLESSNRVNAKRIQWKQMLLMMIRCMIPVLLALAMARPIVLAWRDSGSANAMALAVLLDDSMSMQTLENSQKELASTRWEIACRQLADVADQLPTGSSICVVLAGSPPEIHRDLDSGTLKETMQTWMDRRAFAGKFDLKAGVEKSLDWLQKARQAKRHVLVVSDFSVSDWNSFTEPTIRESRLLLENQAVPVSWSFLNVAKPIDEGDTNAEIAIKAMDIAPRFATVGAPLTVSASVQNFSESSRQLPIRLFADREEIEIQSVTVPPRSTLTTRFRWTPRTIGDIELSVDSEIPDRTLADNSMTRVMRVMAPVRVLLVDGARQAEAMKSESDFVRYALTPFALLQGLPGDVFSTRVVDPNGWDETILKEQDLVVCCNVPELSLQHRSWLRAFVERGGGILFALGDRVQVDRYNAWASISENGLRPGKIQPRTEWNGSVRVSENPFFELTPQLTESISSIQFRQRMIFQDSEPNAWCGFQYDDGTPWVEAYAIGKGRCLWMTSSCDDGDSNFPARPAYLPVMQKLLLFTAQAPSGWRWMEPGKRWVESWQSPSIDSSNSVEWLQRGSATDDAQVATVPLKRMDDAAGMKTHALSDVETPRWNGVVQARLGSEVRKMMIDATDSDRGEELGRDLLAADRFESSAQQAGATPTRSADAWLSHVRSRWSGRELWFLCWLGLMALVLCEIALQQSLMPRQSTKIPHPKSENRRSDVSRGAA